MKLKKLPLLFVPFLLTGCDFDFFGLFPKEEKKEEEKQEVKPGDDDPGEGEDPKLTSVTIAGDLTSSGLTTGSDLKHANTEEKLMAYFNKIENGLVTSYTPVASFVQANGVNNSGLYLCVGSSSSAGSLVLNFSKTIRKVEISLACWMKYVSYGDTYNIYESGAKVTFANQSYTCALKQKSGENDVVITPIETAVGTATSLKIEYYDHPEVTSEDCRVVVRELKVFY